MIDAVELWNELDVVVVAAVVVVIAVVVAAVTVVVVVAAGEIVAGLPKNIYMKKC